MYDTYICRFAVIVCNCGKKHGPSAKKNEFQEKMNALGPKCPMFTYEEEKKVDGHPAPSIQRLYQ